MVKVLTVKIRPVHVIEKQVELSRLRLHDTVQGDAHLGRWFVGGQVLATNRWNFGENFGVSVLQEKVRQVRFSIEVRLSFFLLMSDVACCYTFRSSLFGGFFCQSTREEFFSVFFPLLRRKTRFWPNLFCLANFFWSRQNYHTDVGMAEEDNSFGQDRTPQNDSWKKSNLIGVRFFITSREKILLSLCLERRKEKSHQWIECFFKKYWKITSVQILFDVFFPKSSF